MLKFIKCLLICFAVLAVGVGQIVGVREGFLFGCTGERVEKADCETAQCHSEQPQGYVPVASNAKSLSFHGEGKGAPDHDGQEHKHSELRKAQIVTGFPPVLSLTPLLLFDVPALFEMTGLRELALELSSVTGRMEPPEYGNPPMPQLVAQTIVMLI